MFEVPMFLFEPTPIEFRTRILMENNVIFGIFFQVQMNLKAKLHFWFVSYVDSTLSEC